MNTDSTNESLFPTYLRSSGRSKMTDFAKRWSVRSLKKKIINNNRYSVHSIDSKLFYTTLSELNLPNASNNVESKLRTCSDLDIKESFPSYKSDTHLPASTATSLKDVFKEMDIIFPLTIKGLNRIVKTVIASYTLHLEKKEHFIVRDSLLIHFCSKTVNHVWESITLVIPVINRMSNIKNFFNQCPYELSSPERKLKNLCMFNSEISNFNEFIKFLEENQSNKQIMFLFDSNKTKAKKIKDKYLWWKSSQGAEAIKQIFIHYMNKLKKISDIKNKKIYWDGKNSHSIYLPWEKVDWEKDVIRSFYTKDDENVLLQKFDFCWTINGKSLCLNIDKKLIEKEPNGIRFILCQLYHQFTELDLKQSHLIYRIISSDPLSFVQDVIQYQSWISAFCEPTRISPVLLFFLKESFIEEILGLFIDEMTRPSAKKSLYEIFSKPSYLLNQLLPLEEIKRRLEHPKIVINQLKNSELINQLIHLNELLKHRKIDVFCQKPDLKEVMEDSATILKLSQQGKEMLLSLQKLLPFIECNAELVDNMTSTFVDLHLMLSPSGHLLSEKCFQEAVNDPLVVDKSNFKVSLKSKINICAWPIQKKYTVSYFFECSKLLSQKLPNEPFKFTMISTLKPAPIFKSNTTWNAELSFIDSSRESLLEKRNNARIKRQITPILSSSVLKKQI